MEFVMSNEKVQDEAEFLERLSSDLKPFYGQTRRRAAPSRRGGCGGA